MSEDFFSEVREPIRFGGLGSTDPLSFKVYQPDRLVLGKRMEDHLRVGVCFWHSFAWPGRLEARRQRRRHVTEGTPWTTSRAGHRYRLGQRR